MKSAAVVLIVLLAIVISTCLHARKINSETDEIDQTAVALKGIENVLPANANISIQAFDVPDQTWLYCRYLLFPRNCVLYRRWADSRLPFDTTLSIISTSISDSVGHLVTDRRKVIWSAEYEKSMYYLTCNNY